jgi:hypothetical protein
MDTFYNLDTLSLDEKIALLKDAYDVCFEWWADKLDANKSWSREKIDVTFDEMIAKINDNDKFHFVFIIRDRHYNDGGPIKYIEAGYSTLSSPVDYFLWINLDCKHLTHFWCKYKIMPMSY